MNDAIREPPEPSRPRQPYLLLASASPRRSAILASLGLTFEVRPSDVDESFDPREEPSAVARSVALRKLRKVAPSVPHGVVIAADTIVVVGGAILGKPDDAAHARSMLRRLSDTTHEVITAVALQHRPSGVEREGAETTRVTMRRLDDAEIDAYVATGEPFGKAGAYAIQERADRFVARLDGPFDNVVGFPAGLFRRLLAELLAAAGERVA